MAILAVCIRSVAIIRRTRAALVPVKLATSLCLRKLAVPRRFPRRGLFASPSPLCGMLSLTEVVAFPMNDEPAPSPSKSRNASFDAIFASRWRSYSDPPPVSSFSSSSSDSSPPESPSAPFSSSSSDSSSECSSDSSSFESSTPSVTCSETRGRRVQKLMPMCVRPRSCTCRFMSLKNFRA